LARSKRLETDVGGSTLVVNCSNSKCTARSKVSISELNFSNWSKFRVTATDAKDLTDFDMIIEKSKFREQQL
jgi:hypothetical protein